jgi:hypothetical protein
MHYGRSSVLQYHQVLDITRACEHKYVALQLQAAKECHCERNGAISVIMRSGQNPGLLSRGTRGLHESP